MQREVRGGIPAEIRAEGDGVKVVGYAAVFNEEANIGGQFREVIAPGAFRAAVGRDDVEFLINHDGVPLARNRAGDGTLKLSEDDHGLRIETTLDPENPRVKEIVSAMKRGDLDKMSFAFRATKETWDDTQRPALRTVQEVALYDVSIVGSPAYGGTEIALRSLDKHREQARREQNFHAARSRVRMKMNLGLRVRENG